MEHFLHNSFFFLLVFLGWISSMQPSFWTPTVFLLFWNFAVILYWHIFMSGQDPLPKWNQASSFGIISNNFFWAFDHHICFGFLLFFFACFFSREKITPSKIAFYCVHALHFVQFIWYITAFFAFFRIFRGLKNSPMKKVDVLEKNAFQFFSLGIGLQILIQRISKTDIFFAS